MAACTCSNSFAIYKNLDPRIFSITSTVYATRTHITPQDAKLMVRMNNVTYSVGRCSLMAWCTYHRNEILATLTILPSPATSPSPLTDTPEAISWNPLRDVTRSIYLRIKLLRVLSELPCFGLILRA